MGVKGASGVCERVHVCVCVCVCVWALAGKLAGHVECVKALIEHGANVNASNDTGYVPLHVAVHNHHLLCIQGVFVSVGVSPCLCCCAVPVPGPPFDGGGFRPVPCGSSFHSSSFVSCRPCM